VPLRMIRSMTCLLSAYVAATTCGKTCDNFAGQNSMCWKLRYANTAVKVSSTAIISKNTRTPRSQSSCSKARTIRRTAGIANATPIRSARATSSAATISFARPRRRHRHTRMLIFGPARSHRSGRHRSGLRAQSWNRRHQHRDKANLRRGRTLEPANAPRLAAAAPPMSPA
jgi:hypothetical protein